MGKPSITRREAEVLQAVQQHLSNAEIAARLYVSERTVESHVSSLLRKLGVANRRELARLRDGSASNLPEVATSFVGRSDELDAVHDALSRHRLVTLIGPGGVGKTRLALEAAARAAATYPGGIWLVELAPVTTVASVPATLATVVGVGEQPGEDLTSTVAQALRHRPPSLIVFDNCDHLVAACATLTERIIAAGAGARILATTRERLDVEGECMIAVPPLTEAAAVELFLDRAELVTPTLSEPEVDAVARVCRQLDCMPLVIELAAAQLRVLSPTDLESRLDDRLLRLPRRAGPTSHHASVGAAVAWSYDRLEEPAKRVFERLCVFAGSCAIGAAESVCAADDLPADEVLRRLGELVDRSMVVKDGAGAGTRLRVLEPLRLYGLDRLAAIDEVDRVRSRHATFFLELAHTAEPHLFGPDETAWIARLHAEEANLRAAFEWARDHDRAVAHGLSAALWWYWENSSQHHSALPYLQSLLDTDEPGVDREMRAWTLTAAAQLSAERGETRSAGRWAEEAIATFAAAGDVRGLAYARLARSWTLDSASDLERAERLLDDVLAGADTEADLVLAGLALECRTHVASMRGDHGAARRWGERELAAWTRVGSRTQQAWSYRNLAYAARAAGDLDDALVFADRALDGFGANEAAAAHVRNTVADIARLLGRDAEAVATYGAAIDVFSAIGDRRCLASAQKNLAQLATARGDHDEARRLLIDSLRIRHAFNDALGVAECLDGLGAVAAAADRCRPAVALLAAASTRRAIAGADQLPEDRELTNALLDRLRAALTDDDFDSAWAEGAALDADALLGLAQVV